MFIPRPKQQEVLAYVGGRMGVSAVPGSGKTETLSQLAARLVTGGGLTARQEVLVVTLVNSAVDNFYRRVSALVQDKGLLPHLGYRVRTLHGLAHDIVRERPGLVGLADDFEIVDDRTADSLREEAAAAWLRSHPRELDQFLADDLEADKRDWVRRGPLLDVIKEISLSSIRLAKDRQLTPEALSQHLDELVLPQPLAEMACAIYADYQRGLVYRGAVDFADLIRLALLALQLDEELRIRLRERWPYILEDEAQDSSRLQEDILRMLVGPHGNWVRVGDPNQAIYETFTTANPRLLRNFLKEPGVVARALPNSGRSTQSIIDLANYLVDWTRSQHPEPRVRDALTLPHIEPTPLGDPQPNPPDDAAQIRLLARKLSPAAEVKVVVDSIARWLPKHPHDTVAVLVPRNTRGFELVDALRQADLEVVDSLLRSTGSTRAAAGALANLLRYLSEPVSPSRLATVYKVWRRQEREDPESWRQVEVLATELRRSREVEAFVWPRAGRDWLDSLEPTPEQRDELLAFREILQRWQGTILLPVDQIILTLAQDLFTEPTELAIAHKLAVELRRYSILNPEWRLPQLAEELAIIARNERRFLGFSEDDLGFDPERHRGKVVVATMHKAKGLEWDRVYLVAVNSYNFPSAQPYDDYIGEKWFVRGKFNLEAETLAQLKAAIGARDEDFYQEGQATQEARLDYVRERLRLLYVGITRAKRELIITWNAGRRGDVVPALPLVALMSYWESRGKHRNVGTLER